MAEVHRPDIYIDDISSTRDLAATAFRGVVVEVDVETFAAALDPEGRASPWRCDDCFVLSLLTEQERKPRFQFVLHREGLQVLAEEIRSALDAEREQHSTGDQV